MAETKLNKIRNLIIGGCTNYGINELKYYFKILRKFNKFC